MRIIFTANGHTLIEYIGPRYGTKEEQATKELLAYEQNIPVSNIHVEFKD